MHSLTGPEELSWAFAQISADMRIQYQVGHVSTNRHRDGKWRETEVKPAGHPETTVRSREGYHAPQPASAVPSC
jgi:hypothetical protein